MTTVRMRWLQPPTILTLALLAAVLGVLTAARPSAAGVYSVGFLFIFCLVAIQIAMTKIEITADTVCFSQGPFRPKRQVSRSQVRVIRCYRAQISLVNADGRHIMAIFGHLTNSQLVQMADVLGVPLYDHRAWLGLRSVKEGRLVATGDPAAASKPTPL